jgi:hypothetical protein
MFLKGLRTSDYQFSCGENIMRKLNLAFLTVLALTLTFTSTMSVYAEVQLPANISFKGYALGKCGIARTLGAGLNAQLIWYGEGSGSMALNGYAKATSHKEINDDYFQIYGEAYFTAPGDIHAIGFLALKWFENHELHQLWIAIYSNPTCQGIFQPETDKFLAGFSPSGAIEGLLSYSGIYKIGSRVQYLSGPIGVWASKGEVLSGSGHEIEYIHVVLIYGEPLQYVIHIGWFSEAVSIPMPPAETWTIPATTILVHDVRLR